MIKRFFQLIAVLVIVFIGILLINTFTLKSKQIDAELSNDVPEITNESIKRFQGALQIKTISFDDTSKTDYSKFVELRNYISDNYPLVDSLLGRKIINKYSLLFHWKGNQSNLDPYVLVAHMDVVPIEEATRSDWKYPPFAAEIHDGIIWGRGTLDDKISVFSILEATEILLEKGFVPERDIYLAFGYDEEASGQLGAVKIAKYFEQNGIRPELVLDEGLVVTKGMVPGMEKPVALIGTSEKGYMTVKLKLKMHGGHSSMPGKNTAIEKLADAIEDLQEEPFPSKIDGPVKDFVEYIGPEMPFGLKLAFANMWAFEGVVIGEYQKSGPGAALVHTTMVPTIFNAGMKENVIPSQAEVTYNLRLSPGTSVKDAVDYMTTVIDEDEIEIEVLPGASEPSPVSSAETKGYKTIEKTIREVFENTIVAPSLMIATADARHYTKVSDNVYRFLPIVLDSEQLEGIHGKNEHISVNAYKKSIQFYYRFIKNIE